MAENESQGFDWRALTIEVGSLDSAATETSSTVQGRRALESLLGPKFFRDAVDDYVAGQPGAELARSVMRIVKPKSAIERCVELLHDASCSDDRRAAIELVRFIGDESTVPLIAEFLDDPDDAVQLWAAGILDQRVWDEEIDSETMETSLYVAKPM